MWPWSESRAAADQASAGRGFGLDLDNGYVGTASDREVPGSQPPPQGTFTEAGVSMLSAESDECSGSQGVGKSIVDRSSMASRASKRGSQPLQGEAEAETGSWKTSQTRAAESTFCSQLPSQSGGLQHDKRHFDNYQSPSGQHRASFFTVSGKDGPRTFVRRYSQSNIIGEDPYLETEWEELDAMDPKALVDELDRWSPADKLMSKIFAWILYWWRHPVARMFSPIAILTIDLLLFSIDPVNQSAIETQMPVIGEIFNLVNPFLEEIPYFGHVLKVCLWIVFFYLGASFAKFFRQRARWCRLLRSSRAGCFFPFFCVVLAWAIASVLWNFVLQNVLGLEPLGHSLPYRQETTPFLESNMGFDYVHFGRMMYSFVFFLDCMTVIMTVDTVLQDSSQYLEWGKFTFRGEDIDIRQVWLTKWQGLFRIIVTWTLLVLGAVFAMNTLWEQGYVRIRELEAFGQNEWNRAMIVGFVFCCDIAVVCQDWEFPSFENHLRIAFMGTNLAFEGRFVNYLMLVGVMGVDIYSMIKQVSFAPNSYGMYYDDRNFVWVITQESLLRGKAADLVSNSSYWVRKAAGCFPYENDPYKNICGDEQLQTKFYSYFSDPVYPTEEEQLPLLNNYTILNFVPILIIVNCAFILIFLLRYCIAQSRPDLCRRVIQCKQLAQLQFNLPVNTKGGKKKKVSGEEAVDLDHLIAEQQHTRFRVGGQEVIDVDQDFVRQRQAALRADATGTILVSPEGYDDGRREVKVRLRRPPRSDALLLLISSFGVFEVESELIANVGDLLKELMDKGLHEGIPEERIRLRTGPHLHLDAEDLLGRLLPTPGGPTSVTTIYLQAKLTLGDDYSAHLEGDPQKALEGNEVIEKWVGELSSRPPLAILKLLPIIWDLIGCHCSVSSWRCTPFEDRCTRAKERWRKAMKILTEGIDEDAEFDEEDDDEEGEETQAPFQQQMP